MEWDGYVSELFHFRTAQGDMLATPHIPQVWGMFWDNLYDSSISWIAMFIFTLSLTFTRDEQRISVGELVDGHYRIKFDRQSELKWQHSMSHYNKNINYLMSSTSFGGLRCFAGLCPEYARINTKWSIYKDGETWI